MLLIGEVANDANFGSQVTRVDSATFGQPVAVASFSGLGSAYIPRNGQPAFRLTFRRSRGVRVDSTKE
jgi:hypothetical protein